MGGPPSWGTPQSKSSVMLLPLPQSKLQRYCYIIPLITYLAEAAVDLPKNEQSGMRCARTEMVVSTRGELTASALSPETASPVSSGRLPWPSARKLVPWREWKVWSSYSASNP
jgi:hypothetical protein